MIEAMERENHVVVSVVMTAAMVIALLVVNSVAAIKKTTIGILTNCKLAVTKASSERHRWRSRKRTGSD